jgi:ParB/RepB/Spo0J family partition protein
MTTEPLGGEARDRENTTPLKTAQAVTDKIARKGLDQVQKNSVRLKKLVVEYVEISTISPNTYNPNRQDAETLELLCRSIKEDGFTQPIIVHRQSRQIVDGEHRWRAARKMGMTQIPVAFVDMTDEQMRIATLRHNRARGSEDVTLSVDVLRDLQELGAIEWAQESLMISDQELNELLDVIPVAEAIGGSIPEHSESWVPDRSDPTQKTAMDAGTATKLNTDATNDRQSVSMSTSAASAAQRRETDILGAKTERDRITASQSHSPPYRISFRFTGEEASLVRHLLGDEPANELLRICREIVDQRKKVSA